MTKLKLFWLWVANNAKWLLIGLLALLVVVAYIVLLVMRKTKEAEALRNQLAAVTAEARVSYLRGKMDVDKEQLAKNQELQAQLTAQLQELERQREAAKLRVDGMSAVEVVEELKRRGY